MGNTIVIDLSKSKENIWKNMKRKRRSDISRAKKQGIIIERSLNNIEAFVEMKNKLFEHTNIPISYTSKELLDKGDNLFIARDKDGDMVAGELTITKYNGRVLKAYKVASKRYLEHKKTISGLAHSLLVWEIILWAMKAGYRYYDFGGYSSTGLASGLDVSNINKWKESFGGEIVTKERAKELYNA